MTAQPQDKMRADFEAWAEEESMILFLFPAKKDVTPRYQSPVTEAAWAGWQAACAQQSAQSQQDALDASRARWVLKNATYVTGEFTDQLGIVQSFYWDAELGENIAEEIDLAIAAQGASNV